MSTNHSIGENAMKTNNIPATFMYALVSLKQRILRETATASIGLFRPSAIDQAAEQFRNTLSQDTLWNLNGRFERGAALAKQGAVTHHADPNLANKRRLFQVMSANQSRPPYYYMVDLDFDSCECPDHCKGHYCKHIIASHIYELASHNPQSAKPPTLLFQTPDDAPKTNQPTQSYQVQPKAAPTLSETLLRSSEPCVTENHRGKETPTAVPFRGQTLHDHHPQETTLPCHHIPVNPIHLGGLQNLQAALFLFKEKSPCINL
jgi:hypothetical protein